MSRTKRKKRPAMRLGTLADHEIKPGVVRDGTPQYQSDSCKHHGWCDHCTRGRTFSSRKREPIP